jgi:hypothetical protein
MLFGEFIEYTFYFHIGAVLHIINFIVIWGHEHSKQYHKTS